MSVNIQINIKGSGSKKIISMPCEYQFNDGMPVSVADFLDETVRITLEKYDQAPDDAPIPLMKLFSEEEIEEKAASGKVAFGVHYNTGREPLAKACENARQSFADGIVALFVDEERYESIEDRIQLKEGSSVTFVKLTFLAGRMW